MKNLEFNNMEINMIELAIKNSFNVSRNMLLKNDLGCIEEKMYEHQLMVTNQILIKIKNKELDK
jgi:hypothetical protein